MELLAVVNRSGEISRRLCSAIQLTLSFQKSDLRFLQRAIHH